MDTDNKYFTGDESSVGSVLVLRTENINLKGNFDLFREKLANYVMQNFDNPGKMVSVVRHVEDPGSTFENKHMPKDLTEYQEKFTVQKIIQEQRVKVFVNT